MVNFFKRQWKLSFTQRLLIAGCACILLAAYQPWSPGSEGMGINGYAGPAAMLLLAILPSTMRLGTALGLAVMMIVAISVGSNFVASSQSQNVSDQPTQR